MKTVSVTEVRDALSSLERLLGAEGELIVTRRGRPIARITPPAPTCRFPDLSSFRASMPYQDVPSEILIGKDRGA